MLAKKVIILSGFSFGDFPGTRSFELRLTCVCPYSNTTELPSAVHAKPWYSRSYSFASCMATACSPCACLDFDQFIKFCFKEGVKISFPGGNGKSKYSFALISDMKSKLQSAECEWELNILDWMFFKPKQSCVAASDKNYGVSVPAKELFPSRAMDSFTS